jgi:hypothetical protein
VFSQSTFHKHFSTELPFLKFCRNLILLSVFSLLPFLIVFVALTPEFAKMLMTNTAALGRFSRQVVTNGLPAVFVVNYVGFVATSRFCEKANVSARNHILLDGSVRGGVFVGLHVLVYVFSADLYGSFGGDRWTALRVVGPTLERSYLFENISGVYLYALLPGTYIAYLPIWVNSQYLKSAPRGTTNRFWIVPACLLPVLAVTILSTGLAHLFG